MLHCTAYILNHQKQQKHNGYNIQIAYNRKIWQFSLNILELSLTPEEELLNSQIT